MKARKSTNSLLVGFCVAQRSFLSTWICRISFIMKLHFRSFVWVILVIAMVSCFIFQMWEQLDKFVKGQTTVAVSFEERKTQKFPTFAFCDHRGYRMDVRFVATTSRYNATTFDVESEVILHGLCDGDYTCGRKPKYSVRMVPTTYNGHCKLFEFHEEYPMRVYAGDTYM